MSLSSDTDDFTFDGNILAQKRSSILEPVPDLYFIHSNARGSEIQAELMEDSNLLSISELDTTAPRKKQMISTPKTSRLLDKIGYKSQQKETHSYTEKIRTEESVPFENSEAPKLHTQTQHLEKPSSQKSGKKAKPPKVFTRQKSNVGFCKKGESPFLNKKSKKASMMSRKRILSSGDVLRKVQLEQELLEEKNSKVKAKVMIKSPSKANHQIPEYSGPGKTKRRNKNRKFQSNRSSPQYNKSMTTKFLKRQPLKSAGSTKREFFQKGHRANSKSINNVKNSLGHKDFLKKCGANTFSKKLSFKQSIIISNGNEDRDPKRSRRVKQSQAKDCELEDGDHPQYSKTFEADHQQDESDLQFVNSKQYRSDVSNTQEVSYQPFKCTVKGMLKKEGPSSLAAKQSPQLKNMVSSHNLRRKELKSKSKSREKVPQVRTRKMLKNWIDSSSSSKNSNLRNLRKFTNFKSVIKPSVSNVNTGTKNSFVRQVKTRENSKEKGASKSITVENLHNYLKSHTPNPDKQQQQSQRPQNKNQKKKFPSFVNHAKNPAYKRSVKSKSPIKRCFHKKKRSLAIGKVNRFEESNRLVGSKGVSKERSLEKNTYRRDHQQTSKNRKNKQQQQGYGYSRNNTRRKSKKSGEKEFKKSTGIKTFSRERETPYEYQPSGKRKGLHKPSSSDYVKIISMRPEFSSEKKHSLRNKSHEKRSVQISPTPHPHLRRNTPSDINLKTTGRSKKQSYYLQMADRRLESTILETGITNNNNNKNNEKGMRESKSKKLLKSGSPLTRHYSNKFLKELSKSRSKEKKFSVEKNRPEAIHREASFSKGRRQHRYGNKSKSKVSAPKKPTNTKNKSRERKMKSPFTRHY